MLRGFPRHVRSRPFECFASVPLAELSRTPGTVLQPSRFNGVSERVQACRRKAAECERAAVLATQSDAQIMYRDLACQWRKWPTKQRNLNGV